MQKTAVNDSSITRIFDLPLCSCIDQKCAQRLLFNKAVEEIQMGFSKGYCPKLADDGTSGCYLLRGKSRKPVAVFKPIDEE